MIITSFDPGVTVGNKYSMSQQCTHRANKRQWHLGKLRKAFSPGSWCSTRTGFPERLGNLHPQGLQLVRFYLSKTQDSGRQHHSWPESVLLSSCFEPVGPETSRDPFNQHLCDSIGLWLFFFFLHFFAQSLHYKWQGLERLAWSPSLCRMLPRNVSKCLEYFLTTLVHEALNSYK